MIGDTAEAEKERRRRWNRRYYLAKKDEILRQQKEYKQKNKRKIAERSRQYHQENRDRKREYDKQYREDNKDAIALRKKLWAEDNKEKITTRNRERRQQEKDAGSSGLYSIRNMLNGKKYIGESVFIEERWRQHVKLLNSLAREHDNSTLQKDYNKHGPEAFEFAIIKEINKEDFQTEEQLKEHLRMEEAKMILKEVDEGKELYNISLNPEYVVQVLRERLKQSSIGSIGNA